MIPRRRLLVACSAAVAAVCFAGPAVAGTGAALPGRDREPVPGTSTGPRAVPGPGGAGVSDPYFPKAGNSGYDVEHYRIALDYDRRSHGLRSARTRIDARATRALSSFHLDLHGLTVDAVRVDGRAARWTRTGDELVVTPRRPLRRGHPFAVDVRYHGVPRPVAETGATRTGWVRTADGAVVVAEPTGAKTWFPANDHPSDKARYTFSVTVPRDLEVVANGLPTASRRHGARRTDTWQVRVPMASYLATVAVGDFDVVRSTAPGGLPVITAVPKGQAQRWRQVLPQYHRILAFQQKTFGRYPFESAGAIFVRADLGFALETQSRPVYGAPELRGPTDQLVSLLVHETAHQWFGDSVTPATWRDIWLNEGFATAAGYLWEEHVTGRRLDSRYIGCGTAEDWRGVVADPGVQNLFDGALVYERGATVLLVLRERIGDAAFGALLHRWAAGHRHGTATTAQLERLAERVSGRDLSRFFAEWLHRSGPPSGLPPCPL